MFFLLRVLCVPGPVALREAKLACFYEGGSLPGQSPPSTGGPGPSRCDAAAAMAPWAAPPGSAPLNGGPPPRADTANKRGRGR
jgi:hypothetical protein